MRVSVFGLGYVGCVSAACFARAGHDVVGVDVNPEKVALINAGTSPIVEPGLGDLLADMVAKKRLRATVLERRGRGRDGARPDLRGHPLAEERPARLLGDRARRRTNRARAPRPDRPLHRGVAQHGVARNPHEPPRARAPRRRGPSFAGDLDVAVNPEFMREGSSLQDFVNAPLTLVGCETEEAAAALRSLYLCVNAPFVHTGVAEAEMIKYVSNAYHALKVCFANEIGDLCAALGADAQEVTRVFLMDKKLNVSEAYLRPGFAFGGSCLPKDVRALVQAARSQSLPVPLLDAIVPSNKAQVDRAVEAVLDTHRRRVGIVGLAFKAGTDDLRESPMVTLVETLIGKGCQVRIFDRNVSIARLVGANRRYIEEEIPHISSLMCDDLDAVLAHAEVLVIGNTDEDAARAAAASDRHVVIDLTRRLRPRPVSRRGRGLRVTRTAAPAAGARVRPPRRDRGRAGRASRIGPGAIRPRPRLSRHGLWMNTTYVPPTGRTIAVRAGGDFQTALDVAQPGDVVTLEAGAEYRGPFTLPAKRGAGWIIIRTSAPDAALPPARRADHSLVRACSCRSSCLRPAP